MYRIDNRINCWLTCHICCILHYIIQIAKLYDAWCWNYQISTFFHRSQNECACRYPCCWKCTALNITKVWFALTGLDFVPWHQYNLTRDQTFRYKCLLNPGAFSSFLQLLEAWWCALFTEIMICRHLSRKDVAGSIYRAKFLVIWVKGFMCLSLVS